MLTNTLKKSISTTFFIYFLQINIISYINIKMFSLSKNILSSTFIIYVIEYILHA